MALPAGFQLEEQSNLPAGFQLEQVEPKRSMVDYVKALYEVPTAAIRSVTDPILSSAYGVAASIPEAISTGQPPAPIGQRIAAEMQQKMQYQPTSPVSQDILGAVGGAIESAKIPPYLGNIGMIPSMAKAAQVSKPFIQEAMPSMPTLAGALRKEASMVGVGAAEVPQAVTRTQIAEQLRIPVRLSKGQATKELGQQQFEIETAKNYPETAGKALIAEQATRNENLLQNFDAFVDATGKETYGLRETGRVVDKALINSANKAKKEINTAYELAKTEGQLQEPVSYAPLKQYIDNQTPTVKRKLAPILSAVDEELTKNDPNKTGLLPINSLEDIYKFINMHYEPGTPAALHAKEMKNLINASTTGKGGELYQLAKQLRQDYSKKFEDSAFVDKLLRNKPGTTDRAVAFEDVFKHSILDGSLDDVRNVGYALKKAGPEGSKAWKELQGQTVEHLKDKVTQSVDVDSFGNPVVSPAKFKSAIRELDQDGKLDYILGKSGAQEVRNLLETTINVNAPLKGAANYSNTSSALIRALDKINTSPISRIPVVGSLTKYSFEKATENALNKKVQESINYNPLANALRKGK